MLFGDSWPGVGVGVGLGVGVGPGAEPDVVNVHVGPLALRFAIVLPTMRQKYVVPGFSVIGNVNVSGTPSSTEPVSRCGWLGRAPL